MIEPYRENLFPEFIALAREMHGESEERDGNFNPEKLRSLVCMKDVFCAMSRNADGEYIGFFIGSLNSNFWGNDVTADDMAIFVKPSCRGSSAGVRLIQAFEKWAIENGAKRIYLAQATGVAVDKTTRLFEKLGYQIVGSVTRKMVTL
jgi:GNAT superfamily N-acetyltransferase